MYLAGSYTLNPCGTLVKPLTGAPFKDPFKGALVYFVGSSSTELGNR